jgi:hypothetical protein
MVICTALLAVVPALVTGGVVVPGGVVAGGGVELLPPTPMPPEFARISATPDKSPALNVTVATPFLVCAEVWLSVPIVVENVTVVPFCTGVPLDSATNAEISVLPPSGSVNVPADTDIVELVGASSGTLSQAPAVSASSRHASPASDRPRN